MTLRDEPIRKTKEDLRVVAESIIDGYETRVKTISGMMRQAYQLMLSYQQDVEDALSLLRDNMAKGQSLRRTDFDKIMSDVADVRARRQQQTSQRLDAFAAEEEDMVARLRRIVASGKGSDLTDLRKIQEDILTRQRRRERDVISVLRSFETQELELRTSLRRLLDRGKEVTITHLQREVNALTSRWTTEHPELFDAFEQLEDARSRVRSRWQDVANASA